MRAENVYSISVFPIQSLDAGRRSPLAEYARGNRDTGFLRGDCCARTHCEARLERKRAMSPRWNRRDVLKGLAAASTAIIVRPKLGAAQEGGGTGRRPVEIQIAPVSAHTFRLTLFALGT